MAGGPCQKTVDGVSRQGWPVFLLVLGGELGSALWPRSGRSWGSLPWAQQMALRAPHSPRSLGSIGHRLDQADRWSHPRQLLSVLQELRGGQTFLLLHPDGRGREPWRWWGRGGDLLRHTYLAPSSPNCKLGLHSRAVLRPNTRCPWPTPGLG